MEFNFTGSPVLDDVYDWTDFTADAADVARWEVYDTVAWSFIMADGPALLDKLFSDGVTNPITQEQNILGTEYSNGPQAGPQGRVLHVFATNESDDYYNVDPGGFFDGMLFSAYDFDIIGLSLGEGDDSMTGIGPFPVIVSGGKGDDYFDFTAMDQFNEDDLVSIVYTIGDGSDHIEDVYEFYDLEAMNYRGFVSGSGVDAIYLQDIELEDFYIRWDAEYHSSIEVRAPERPESDGRKEFYIGKAELIFRETGEALDIGYVSGELWKNEADPISYDNGEPIYWNPDSTTYHVSFLNRVYLTDDDLNTVDGLYGGFVPLDGGMGYDGVEYMIV